jgi:uncharacterized protein (DUF3084 family)
LERTALEVFRKKVTTELTRTGQMRKANAFEEKANIGDKLGSIHADVKQVHADVKYVREDVKQVHEKVVCPSVIKSISAV